MTSRGSTSLSLAWKATFVVAVYSALAAGACLFWISRQENHSVREELAQRLLFDLNVRTTDVAYYVESMQRTAHVLSGTPPIQGMNRAAENGGIDPTDGSTYETWRARLETIFTATLVNHPTWFQVRYLHAQTGRELVRVERRQGSGVVAVQDSELQAKAHRPYMRALPALRAGSTYIAPIDLNRERGELQEPHVRTLRVGTPVFGAEGGLIGLVLINADVGILLDDLKENLEEGARVYVLNASGDFLVHPDPGMTFGFDLGRPRIGREIWSADWTHEEFLGRPEQLKSVLATDGESLLVAARHLQLDPRSQGGWLRLIVAVPESEVNRHVATTRRRLLGGLAIVALPIVCLMLWQLHRSLAPLRSLATSVRRFGEGSFDEELPETAPGEVGHLIGAFRQMAHDLGDRQRQILELNDELRHSEKTASLIVETAPNAIVVVDGDGQIERVNRQLESVFGYRREDLVGKPLEQLLPESVREGHRDLRREYVKAPVAREMGKGRDLFGRHRDGTEIPVEIGLAPMVLDDKIRVIGTITDIRVRKAALEEVRRLNAELEQRVRERTAELEESNQELEAFAYSVSHDLRAPLRAINGFSRILEEDYAPSLDKEGLRLLAVVRDNTQRMAQLIDDLLAFSRVARQQLEKVAVDMAHLARVCFGQVRLGYDNAEDASLQIGELPPASGDPILLRQVWTNLLDNALKYSPNGVPKVEVSGRRQGGMVRYEVADHGVGFDMRYADKLFGVFQRLHSAEEIEGTGVGLAFVHRIVSRHGGEVWASGVVGEGARFGFSLPSGDEPYKGRGSGGTADENFEGIRE